MSVDDVKQLLCIVVLMTTMINLQFNAKKSLPFAVKDCTGLEVIIMDRTVFPVITIEAIAVIIGVIRVLIVDDPAAILAPIVVIIEAVLTKESIIIGDGIVLIDQFTAPVAMAAFVIGTCRAQDVVIDIIVVIILDHGTAARADELIFLHGLLLFFFHGFLHHDMKMTPATRQGLRWFGAWCVSTRLRTALSSVRRHQWRTALQR